MPGMSQESSPQLPAVHEHGPKVSNSSPAGEKSGVLSLEIVSGSKSAYAQAELNFVRQAWAELGIDLAIRYITDWTEFEAYINSDQVQIYRYAWFADMPDPDSFFYPLFATNSAANFMEYRDEEVNSLILSARGKSDSAERAGMYREIETLIMKSTPVIPLTYPSVHQVYKSYVQGAQPSALGADYMSLHRVWLKNAMQTQ
jgi:ABC-type oligopeptide transport system substrate-binding subunit